MHHPIFHSDSRSLVLFARVISRVANRVRQPPEFQRSSECGGSETAVQKLGARPSNQRFSPFRACQ